jgi:predicted phosphodiesterase
MRFLVVADVHANITALESVIEHARKGEGFDEVWSLGDTVGYGPDPGPCIDLLSSMHAFGVGGNHDKAATGAGETPDFNPDAVAAIKWTRNQISNLQGTWLDRQRNIETDGEFTLVHGSPRDPLNEYVLREKEAMAVFPLLHTPYCVCGHTHVPVIFRLSHSDHIIGRQATDGLTVTLDSQSLIINPGSVGQPRDSDARAAYLIIDTIERKLMFHRVRYDVAKVQARMRQAGLPWRLIVRLGSGR